MAVQLSIQKRLGLILVITSLFTGLLVVGLFQMAKGARFHYLNALHLKHVLELTEHIEPSVQGLPVVPDLRRMVNDIRQQPVECLQIVNGFDRAVMRLIGTGIAIDLCEQDIAEADRLLAGLNRYERGQMDADTLYAQLRDGCTQFRKNSDQFLQPITATTDFIISGTFSLFAVLATAMLLGTLLLMRGIAVTLHRQRQMESGLRESEERWKFALEGAGDGVWDWNIATGEVLYSKRFKEMLGYAEHEITENLYVHPFTVSNAALEARTAALLLRNQMLQMALSGSPEKAKLLADDIIVLDGRVRKNLAAVREGFLGDLEKVDEAERQLQRWESVRTRTVELVSRGARDQAVALITGDNAVVFDGLFGAIDEIVDYARRRAENFVREGEQESVTTIRLTGLLLAGLVAMIGLAGFIVVRRVAATLHREQGMESALRESEERWKFALEGAGDGVWDWNIAADEVLYSKRFKEMLGYAEHEFSNRLQEWQERVHPDDLPRVMAEVQAYFEGRTADYVSEHRMRCKDGSWKWILDRGMVVSRDAAGQPLRMIGTHADVTERKNNEVALQESRARLAGIIDSAMDAIITIDQTRRIVVFNHASEVMFRIRAADAIGGYLDQFIPERFRAEHGAQILNFGVTGATKRAMGRAGTVQGLRADGEEFPAEAAISRAEVDGKFLLSVVLRDITGRVAAEEERQLLESELRQSQKLEAIGTLAGGIAHDFNNVLGAILGNVELARQDLGGEHPALESLEQIRKSGERARDLVQQILIFSRKQTQQFCDLALGAAVAESVKLLRAAIPAGVALETTLADTPLYVHADESQMHQVLLNLCINAWQAMEGHAGRIDIGLEAVDLDAVTAARLPGLQAGRHAHLSIRDDGQGMDEVTQTRLFEPFFTTKPVGQGTGLGLAVVHGIVQAHHGAIAVQSAVGKGTTFDLYFPLVEAPAQVAVQSPQPVVQGAGKRILYVDDDTAMTHLVCRMLERCGYKVSGYEQAEEALAAVRADPSAFDLVVTDYNMPKLSGMDVARELARIRVDLPVMLISGYVTDELREAARQVGVRHIVYKPNTVRELCETIEQVFRKQAAEAQQA